MTVGSLSFFDAEAPPRQGRLRTKPKRSRHQAFRSRLWTLRLMDALGASLDQLNCQLVLPPTNRPFVLGSEPPPLTPRTQREKTFQGPLERGTDPAGMYFGSTAERYSLAARVEEHVPGSRAWLLEDIAPYLERNCPPIGTAVDLQSAILSRLGLHCFSEAAAEYGFSEHPDLCHRLVREQLAWLAEVKAPEHLALLVAMCHIRHWLRPRTEEAFAFYKAVRLAFGALAQHSSVMRHTRGGRVLVAEVHSAAEHVVHSIKVYGHRSIAPENEFGQPQVPTVPWHTHTLLCGASKRIGELDSAAALQVCIPMEHIFDGAPAERAYEGDYPSQAESRSALLKMLTASDPSTWPSTPSAT